MIQVSDLAALQSALAQREADIRLAAGIDARSPLTVNYALTLSSAAGGPFTLRKTAGFSGSLLRVVDGGALTVEHLILDGSLAGHYSENTANRSLIQVAGGSLHLGAGALLENNSSYQEGGGVYLSGDPAYTNRLLMDADARVAGCSSRTSGGGVMGALRSSGDSVTIRGAVSIDSNTASNGGGLYVRAYTPGVSAAVTVEGDASIVDNTAAGNGGGIYCSGYTGEGSGAIALILRGNAYADRNQALHGGGIAFFTVSAGDRLSLEGTATASDNTAAGNGGGVYLTAPTGGAEFSMAGGGLDGNTAGTGGGLYLLTASGGLISVAGGRISSNSAINGPAGSGGGLWLQNTSEAAGLNLILTSAEIERNRASAGGGGIALTGGAPAFGLTAEDTAVAENTAGGNGGGILIGAAGGGKVNFSLSALTRNRSGGSGGGMYYANTGPGASFLALRGATVSENSAQAEGGGLRLTSGTGYLETLLSGCAIQDNTASENSGGGVWNGGGDDHLIVRDGTLITRNRTVDGNGGGIYFNSDSGTLELSGAVQITYNEAASRESTFGGHGGGVCVVPGQVSVTNGVEIAFNRALLYGGGLSAAEGSSVAMAGGRIHDNVSGGSGGGVWNHGGSRFLMTGGAVYGNAAQVGGGFYNDDAGSLTVEDIGQVGAPEPNTAAVAPGIYNDALFYTRGERDLENGLAIAGREAVARLKGAMAAGAVVQLNATDYVAPDPARAPIVVAEATDAYPLLTGADAGAFRKPVQGFADWEVRLSSAGTQVVLVPAGAEARYTITYCGNDACGPCAHCLPPAQSVGAGESAVLPPCVPVRACYRFLGWNTKADGSGMAYRPGETIPEVESDLVLYAQWEPLTGCCCLLR